MCGIFGCFMPTGLGAERTTYIRANDVAAHRGPDGRGVVWMDTRPNGGQRISNELEPWEGQAPPTTVLGHRRLAIIDLSDDALQPMANADRSLWITFNGEIYNFIELRAELEKLGAKFFTSSDTEVALKAYEVWGLEAFEKFIGMWAIGILDKRARRLVLSRDRFGIKPLHYVADERGLAFASEIRQLLELPHVSRSPNRHVIYDYLRFEATDCGAETFFASVRRVMPGHCLIVSLDDASLTEKRYYQPLAAGIQDGLTAAGAAEQFRALLKESVRIHLRADVPVGTCLSGGLDSSSIAMLMREVAADAGLDVERHAFNCHFDLPEADELEFTKQTVAASKVKAHYTLPTEADLLRDLDALVRHQQEPFGSTSIFAQWCVFRLVKERGIKVVLDGQGADEMLGGYASTVPHFLLEQVAHGRHTAALYESWQWARMQGRPWHTQLPYPRVKAAAAKYIGARAGVVLPEPDWVNPDLTAECAASSEYVRIASENPMGPMHPFGNALYRFFFRSNLPALLRFEDRNSMAFSVEARVPFLDHRLVDFAFSIPGHLKMRDGFTKRVLRDSMHGTLPEEVRMRKRKMGFATPERRWQSGPLKDRILGALDSAHLKPYVKADPALAHFQNVSSNNTLSFSPWRWLNLAMWHEQYVSS